MIRRIPLVCVAVCLLVSHAAAQQKDAAKTYAIRLFRPAKVGDRYRLKASENKKHLMIVSRDGKVVQSKSKETRVELEADVEIVHTDSAGRPLTKSITIERFVDGKKNELLPKGQVVIAETIEGKTVFRLKEGPVPVVARMPLSEIIKTHSAGQSDDDVSFGTKENQAVGAQWTVNAADVAREMKVDPKAVSGTVTLKERKKINGVDCLQLVVDIAIPSFPNAREFIEGGYRLKDPSIVARIVGDYPVDTAIGHVGRTSKVTIKATMIGNQPKLKGVVIAISGEVTSEKTRAFAKSPGS